MTELRERVVPISKQTGDLLRQVEQFLYLEAELMDEHRYAEWLALWNDQLVYWVPASPDDESPELRVAVVYDDRLRLEERLARWTGGYAHAQIPRPALSRIVGNVRLVGEEDGLVIVRSRFLLTLLRPGADAPRLASEMVFAGSSEHRLAQAEGPQGFTIASKTSRLLNAHLPLPNIQFLL